MFWFCLWDFVLIFVMWASHNRAMLVCFSLSTGKCVEVIM